MIDSITSVTSAHDMLTVLISTRKMYSETVEKMKALNDKLSSPYMRCTSCDSAINDFSRLRIFHGALE